MLEFLSGTWPWYVAGPMIGMIFTLLLLLGGRVLGISSNFRHLCAAVPAPDQWKPAFLRYNWRASGLWNLTFLLGITLGGFISLQVLGEPNAGMAISQSTQADLAAIGITDFSGLVPSDLFAWGALGSLSGIAVLVVGGFLVGFGARYAGGCTSGHAISGLANLQLPSLVAVLGFFAGGLLVTFGILPLILR